MLGPVLLTIFHLSSVCTWVDRAFDPAQAKRQNARPMRRHHIYPGHIKAHFESYHLLQIGEMSLEANALHGDLTRHFFPIMEIYIDLYRLDQVPNLALPTY